MTFFIASLDDNKLSSFAKNFECQLSIEVCIK